MLSLNASTCLGSTTSIRSEWRTGSMSSTTLYRLSGISLFWGGGLIAFGYIFHPADNPAYLATLAMILVHLMIFFGVFLLLLGWIGMYARQSSRAGIWGLAGMLLLFFGLLML